MNIPMDKQSHFWWGMAMCALLAHTGVHLFGAFAISGLAGLLKEFLDMHTKNHKAEGYDFLATMLGAFVAAAVVWVVRL